MFARLALSAIRIKPLRVFFSNLPPLKVLSNMFLEAESHLAYPEKTDYAVDLFKKVAQMSMELYPTRPLSQSYWNAQIAYKLGLVGYQEEAKKYLAEALDLLNQHDTSLKSTQLADVYMFIGQTYTLLFMLDESEVFLSKALEIELPLETKISLMDKLASVKLSLNKQEESKSLCETALGLLKTLPSSEIQKAELLMTLARTYYMKKTLSKSIELYDSALSILGQIEDEKSFFLQACCYELKVVSCIYIGTHEEAVKNAVKGGELIRDKFDSVRALIFYANMYEKFMVKEKLDEIIGAMIELLNEVPEGKEASHALRFISQYFIAHGDVEQGLEYSEKMLNIVKKLDDSNELFYAYVHMANHQFSNKVELAKTYIDLAQDLLNKNPDNHKQNVIDYLLFQYSAGLNEYEAAEEYMKKCLENTPESLETVLQVIDLHKEYSKFLLVYSKLEKAIQCELKVIQLVDQYIGPKDLRKIESLAKLGNLYSDQADYEKGLEYSFTALDFIKEHYPGLLMNYLFVYTTIVSAYKKMNQPSLAVETALEIVPLFKESQETDPLNAAIFYFELANAYEGILNKSKAKEYYFQSKELFKKIGSDEYVQVVEERLENLIS